MHTICFDLVSVNHSSDVTIDSIHVSGIHVSGIHVSGVDVSGIHVYTSNKRIGRRNVKG